jgi:peptide-methionine (S)-S-oxide reductase
VFWQEHHPDAQAWSQQYKAAVFVHDAAQRKLAELTRDAWSAANHRKALTEIIDAGPFHLAEDYHQKWQLRRDDDLARELGAIYDQAGLRDSTAAARINGYLGGHGSAAQLRAELPRLGLSDRAGAELLARVEALDRDGAGPGCR